MTERETVRDKICLTCKFLDPETANPKDTAIPAVANRLACRRFPTIEWKRRNEWCGEWQQR